MSKFVHGTELTLSIENIIRTAQQQLYIIAPAIHFHPRLKEELRKKKAQDSLQVTIVFGSVSADIHDSISKDELALLKEFPNVVICYEEKLGSKYYANESTALLTSISLADYANNTSVETGMLLQAKGVFKQLAGTITNSITETEKSSMELAQEYFSQVITKSRELFRKTPQYDKGFMNLSKKYSRSIEEVNKLVVFLETMTPEPDATVSNELSNAADKSLPLSTVGSAHQSTIGEIKEELFKTERTTEPVPVRVKAEEEFQPGYCIRTGTAIFFDPRNPFSAAALAEWKKENDPEFPENYCHFSGEPSFGQTSANRPILQKNLRKAQLYV